MVAAGLPATPVSGSMTARVIEIEPLSVGSPSGIVMSMWVTSSDIVRLMSWSMN